MKKFFSKTLIWEVAKNDKLLPKCAAILFKNVGDVSVKINDTWQLDPGEETPTISTGHPECVDLTEYRVSFDVSTLGTNPLVRAIYTQAFPIKTKDQAKACEIL